MASAAAEGEEAPIAAFAVSKGGVVLKNIFLNAPPSPLPVEEAARGRGGEEEDPPVMFGRHPECHVLVDHPSVSRFHLEVRSRRRQRRITVTDLSSGEIPLLPRASRSASPSISLCAWLVLIEASFGDFWWTRALAHFDYHSISSCDDGEYLLAIWIKMRQKLTWH